MTMDRRKNAYRGHPSNSQLASACYHQVNKYKCEGNIQQSNSYRKIYSSLMKYPLPITSSSQLCLLEGVGRFYAQRLAKELKEVDDVNSKAIDFFRLGALRRSEILTEKIHNASKESNASKDTHRNFVSSEIVPLYSRLTPSSHHQVTTNEVVDDTTLKLSKQIASSWSNNNTSVQSLARYHPQANYDVDAVGNVLTKEDIDSKQNGRNVAHISETKEPGNIRNYNINGSNNDNDTSKLKAATNQFHKKRVRLIEGTSAWGALMSLYLYSYQFENGRMNINNIKIAITELNKVLHELHR